MTRLIVRVALMAVALFVPALSIFACASEAHAPGVDATGESATGESATGSLRVEDAWVRINPGGMGAAYFSVRAGPQADRLLSVTTSVAGHAELHTTRHEGDTMQMRPVDVLDVPAGGVLTFEPGGNHVMLFDVEDAPAPGNFVPVVVQFENAGAVEVQAEVRGP